QLPASHICCGPQTLPQVPQLTGSTAVLAQERPARTLQSPSGAAQAGWQALPTQEVVPPLAGAAQATPQPPQLSLLVARSTQAPLQISWPAAHCRGACELGPQAASASKEAAAAQRKSLLFTISPGVGPPPD